MNYTSRLDPWPPNGEMGLTLLPVPGTNMNQTYVCIQIVRFDIIPLCLAVLNPLVVDEPVRTLALNFST